MFLWIDTAISSLVTFVRTSAHCLEGHQSALYLSIYSSTMGQSKWESYCYSSLWTFNDQDVSELTYGAFSNIQFYLSLLNERIFLSVFLILLSIVIYFLLSFFAAGITLDKAALTKLIYLIKVTCNLLLLHTENFAEDPNKGASSSKSIRTWKDNTLVGALLICSIAFFKNCCFGYIQNI